MHFLLLKYFVIRFSLIHIFRIFFRLSFLFRINVASKKKDKKHWGGDKAMDSEEDEDSDESSVKELYKIPKSKKTTKVKCKFPKTSMLSILFFMFFNLGLM